MKKITIWLLLVLAAAIFTGCSDDSNTTAPGTTPVNNDAPAVQILEPAAGNIDQYGTVSVKIKIKAKKDFIETVKLFLDGNILYEFTTPQSSANDTLRTYSWTLPSNFSGTHTLHATAKDKGGIEGKSSNVSLKAVTGTISPWSSSLYFYDLMVGLSKIKPFLLVWDDLPANTNMSITAPAGFLVSLDRQSGFGSTLSVSTGGGKDQDSVYVKFTPSEVKYYEGYLSITHPDAVTRKILLTGTGETPVATLSVSANNLTFGYTAPQSNSTAQSFTVSGVLLNGNINITAPSGFEISQSATTGFAGNLSITPANGSVQTTIIYCRFSPTAAQTYSGNLTVATTGITTKNISVTGTAVQTVSTMILVEGGTFQMGSTTGESYEQPVHSVTLSSFQIGKYEVTQTEWVAMMGSNPSYFTGDLNRPIETVSWYDIMVYCNKRSMAESLTPCYTINGSTNPTSWGAVPTSTSTTWDAATCNWSANGYRLPTEAEWEFAARGGNSSNGYTYSGSNTIGDVAWYSSNSNSTTHAVGTKAPNELGIYDMSGNVWEWNWDWYGSYSSSVQTNPHGATTGSVRVNRGGGYDYDGDLCRVAYRRYYSPYGRLFNIGFRLCRAL